MTKKLIAVALAALPAAAMADVTLYGTLKASLEHDTLTGNASQSRLEDNTSIIGFKGSEDLGNGLKAVWQVENRVYLDGNRTEGFGSRDSFIGLDGGELGQVRIGHVANLLNDQYAVDQWQYNGNVKLDGVSRGVASGANGLSVFTNSAERLKNAVRYDSADFSGLSGSVMIGFGENAQVGNNPGRASDIASAGLNYRLGNFGAHYVVQREANPDQPASTGLQPYMPNNGKAALKQLFAADYHNGPLFVAAAYQTSTGYDWTDDMAGDGQSLYNGKYAVAGQLKARQAALSAAYTIGAFTPKLSIARGWNLRQGGVTLDETGYRQVVAGVDYALSRRTTAGLSVGKLWFDRNTSVARIDNGGAKTALTTVALTVAHGF